jgi:putative ubiquitin-RnfH superfamily antitoxin RatB of RatAB toxin-antitoxin module
MGEEVDFVQVVYATPEIQRVVEVSFSDGLTVLQAVERSGLFDEFPGIRSNPLVLGVYGERVEPDRKLAPGERAEICRPLQQDPRDMRSSVVAHGGVMGRPKDGEAD